MHTTVEIKRVVKCGDYCTITIGYDIKDRNKIHALTYYASE